MERVPQSIAKRVVLKAYLSTDHVTDATGKTLAVVISKNGAAFGNPSAGATNATETGSGWYYFDASTTDTGTAGPLVARATGTGVDNVEIELFVVDAHNAGFDGVPSAVAAAANGLLILGTNATASLTGVTVPTVTTVGTLTTYTGDTPQTGDAFLRIGAAGAGLTALGDTRIANLDATVSSRTKPADTQARVTLVDTLTTYTGNTVQTGDAFARLGIAGVGLTNLGDTRIANLDATVSSRTKPADTQARVTLVDTVTTYTGNTVQTGDAYARLGAPAGASVSADVAAVKSDTGGIKTKTDSLTFTVASQVDANVLDWKGATAPAMTGDAFARLGAPVGASISADIAGVQSDTDNLQTRIPAALVSGRIDASVGAMAADTLTASALASDAVAEIQSGLSTLTAGGVRTAVGLVSANLDTQLALIQSDTDDLQTRVPAALVSGRMDSSTGAMAANTLTASALATDAVTEIQSGLSTLDAAGVRTAVGLATANLDTQIAAVPAAVLKADWSGITGEAARSLLNAARGLRNKVVISGGTLTVYKEDGTTVAFTETVATDVTAQPIVSVTP